MNIPNANAERLRGRNRLMMPNRNDGGWLDENAMQKCINGGIFAPHNNYRTEESKQSLLKWRMIACKCPNVVKAVPYDAVCLQAP